MRCTSAELLASFGKASANIIPETSVKPWYVVYQLLSYVVNRLYYCGDFQEFFKRRADVELDYSRGLDKLHRTLTQRQKDLKQRWVGAACQTIGRPTDRSRVNVTGQLADESNIYLCGW